MKFAKYVLAVFVLLFVAFLSLAQSDTSTDGAPEEHLELALADLSTQVGAAVTPNDINYRWRGERFPNASLGCPRPDEVYAQVMTPGYQFLIEYGGAVYDYRVSEDGTIVSLCSTIPVEDATLAPLSTPVETTATSEAETCTESVTVVTGDTLRSVAERCGVTAGAIVDANPDLQSFVGVLVAGEVLQIPVMMGDDDMTAAETVVAIYPISGEAGSRVSVIINGLDADAEVSVGIGSSATDFSVLETVSANEDGAVSTELTIPDTASAGEEWVIVVADDENTAQTVSLPFTVR